MERREVLRLLGSAAAISAFPLEAIAALKEASAQVALTTGLRTLSPSQNVTVTTIAELIIPATDTPGAKGAKVNEFIDLLLTEWYYPPETKEFLAGLASLDALAKARYSAAFADCTPVQQTELLTELDDQAMKLSANRRRVAAAVSGGRNGDQVTAAQQDPAGEKPTTSSTQTANFYYQMKKLTLAGYYTTDIGFTQELGKSMFSASHEGCAPMPERAK
jgi:hypothetical protein